MSEIQEYEAEFHPGSTVDYGRIWGVDLEGNPGFLQEGEEIITSDWVITSDREAVPTLIEAPQGSGISDDKQATAIYLTGGTAGVVYKLTNTITTLTADSTNRVESRTGIIKCCNK